VFARVVTTDVSPNGMESAMSVVHEHLPEALQQPGLSGFYLLADREAGKLMTISLWKSRESLLAVEERAAELNSQMAGSGRMAAPEVTVYEVLVQK
jgi:heme-degrading monooxygenase HmoA